MKMTFESVAETSIPSSRFKEMRVIGFETQGVQALAIVSGALEHADAPLIRVHSQCLFGEVLHSLKCDCLGQLHLALDRIQNEGPGAVIYLYQEGRGAGLLNKIKGYHLSEQGLDTVEAYQELRLPVDSRDYKIAADILHHLAIPRVRLMTNNPDKIAQLERHGITVLDRVPAIVPSSLHSEGYLRTKMLKMNHDLIESLSACS